jgi:tetratricopeptide (TPR) repeat protein
MNDPVLFGEVLRGLMLLGMGDLDQAEKYVQNSNAKKSPRTGNVFMSNLALGKIRLVQGREDEAKAHFETCLNLMIKTPNAVDQYSLENLLHLTSIYAKHGDLEKAREMSDWARRLAEIMKGDACSALASQAEAMVLLAAGDGKGAEEAYLKALRLWEKAGWPYYHGEALVAYSEAIAQNNPEESRKRLMQAVEIFRKLGAKRDLEQAEAKLSAK